MATKTAAPVEKAMVPFARALEICGVSQNTLRGFLDEFTISRDGVGRGFRIKVRRDECEVYAGLNERFPEGGIESVRKFRRIKGRA